MARIVDCRLFYNGKDCGVIHLKVLLIRPKDLIVLEAAL